MTTNKQPVDVQFKGVLRWASIPPNPPQKQYEPKEGQENNTHYSIEVECGRDQFYDLLDKGLPQTHKLVKDEETGKTFIRVKCPKINGKYVGKDPSVQDVNGNPVTVKLANGSEGVVNGQIQFFTSKSGKPVSAFRFTSVLVTKLVEFVPENPNEMNNPHEQEEAHSQDLNSDGPNW